MRWSDESRKRQDATAQERHLMDQANIFTAKIKEAGITEKLSAEVLALQPIFTLEPKQVPDGSNFIASELFSSPESAPALMLHFTEHPEELQRIAALTTPRAVSREMAKIEARLEAATAGTSSKSKEEVSKAAPPVKPVSGVPYVAESDEYREGMSFDEYARLRQKQIRSRR